MAKPMCFNLQDFERMIVIYIVIACHILKDVCVCVCVKRERERERERVYGGEIGIQTVFLMHNMLNCIVIGDMC